MALGKRKEREAEAGDDGGGLTLLPHPTSTLFVSNLPYNATSVDLQTLFSDIAPVRNAFVVCEHGTGVSKGVGYVSFAIREDAKMAYDKILKDGISLVGRNLRVEWADHKVKKQNTEASTEKSGTGQAQKKSRPPQHRVAKSHDPLAIRTVVISGLPASIDSKALWKKIRKYQGAEKVEWPVKTDDGAEDTSTAHALFSTPAIAQDAVAKLHAHVFKGSLLSVTLKKRLDTLASHIPIKSSTLISSATSTATPSPANRLIVRNLPFTATEQDLRSVFLPHGPIYSINMPLKEPAPASDSAKKSVETEENDLQVANYATKTSPRLNKGFSFVWFFSRNDAERAMEKCNGMRFRAGAAEELIEGKQKRKKERRMEKKLAAIASNKQEKDGVVVEEKEETDDDDKGEKGDKNERVIAVDWALSKDRWEEEKAKIDVSKTAEDDDEETDEINDTDSASEREEGLSGNEEDGLGVHEDGASASEEDEEDVESAEDNEPTKPQLPQTDVGTTLFIRNVPYDATEDELRTLFRPFGPLRYARITMDPATGRSRGTGFSCFWNKEDADKVIQQSELLKAETTGGNSVSVPKKKNPFSLPSILTPDPSSSLAQNLVLHGRALDVTRAVTRDEAGRLKEEGERSREKADKRNMYLLREGVILPNNPEASSISPADLDRRTKSYNARRALLKTNPSLYISKTRLSVRQIPTYVTDHMLKRLALYAVRAFEREVKHGDRSSLSAEELADLGGRPGQVNVELTKEDPSDNEREATPSLSHNARRKARLQKLVAQPGVKQAKVIRQAERIDPITGKGRSRGYGFVEMDTHADALRVLRWANNNLGVHSLLRDWWKEELERLIKVERDKLKGKDKADEEDDVKLKRMTAELEKATQRGQGRADEEADGGIEGGARQNRGTLIVEFSIENIQIVQKRDAMQRDKAAHKPGDGALRGKKMLDDGERRRPISGEPEPPRISKAKDKRIREDSHEPVKGKQRPQKKRRVSDTSLKDVSMESKVPESPHHSKEGSGPLKPGEKIGSIIGRKRKDRKDRKAKIRS